MAITDLVQDPVTMACVVGVAAVEELKRHELSHLLQQLKDESYTKFEETIAKLQSVSL